MGLVLGALMVGVLYTGGYLAKVRAAKLRFLGRIKESMKGQKEE